MSRRIPTLLLAAATTVSLAACGSDTSPAESSGSATTDSSSSAPTTQAPTSAASTASSSAAVSTTASAPATALELVAVNKTIKDPVLGHSVVVLQYVANYQPSAAAKAKYASLEDQSVLLVQVKPTAGSKYYNSVSTSDFRLTKTANGIDATPTSILDDEVKAAGYPILEDVRAGKTGTGWIVFTPKKEYTKLVFAYKRLAYKTSDGKSFPEQVYPLPLN